MHTDRVIHDGVTYSRRHLARLLTLCSTGAIALTLGSAAALAQDAAAISPATASDARAGDDTPQEITVTGSRIARTGFSTPTPVSVITSKDIDAVAPANIADFVNTLPSIASSPTTGSSSGNLSLATAGINAINLRGLGTARTLVLLDGQRSVPSTIYGTVDINTIPQELVERVEIVTGGASAAYGSDAVGGVVNFILDKKYTGIKTSFDTGISTYGDAPYYKTTLTAGGGFLNDRLHLLFSGGYFHQTPVDTVDRSWNDTGFFQINNPAFTSTNGLPQRIVSAGIGPSQVSPGGLIVSGPLRGTYFGAIDPATGVATTGQLNYGAVANPWMIGGDWRYTLSNYAGTNSLVPEDNRASIFTRASFDITPDIQVYGQFSYNRDRNKGFYQQTPNVGNVTIMADNAFLPASVRSALTAAGQRFYTMGTTNAGTPPSGYDFTREVQRYVAGATGKFGLFGRDWQWNAYFQRGVTKSHEKLIDVFNSARLSAATDAVFAPAGNAAGIAAGTIVCRSTLVSPNNGCVPINRIGVGGVTQAAINYIEGTPTRDETLSEDVASLTVSGDLFDLPGGPVSIAFGGEYRREKISGEVDPQYSSGWQYGNFLATNGSYNVKEGFVEIDAPLFKGFNVNAAGRYTSYSVSGDVQTWKAGATYQPIPDIKFRGTYSRDIRAPNLSELYTAGAARTNTVIVPNSGTVTFTQRSVGNLSLDPEVAKTWSVGTILTPRFARGFNLSVDYYNISIDKAIGSLSAQNTVDLCYLRGLQDYCGNITSGSVNGVDTISQILLTPFNFAKQKASGLDIEASYRTRLADHFPSVPGDLTLRAMFTHYIHNIVDDGVNARVDYAGSNLGNTSNGFNATPSWTYRISALYEVKPVTLNFVARGFSSGVYSNNYIECTSACPATEFQHYTINDNHIAGATYFDASIGFDIPMQRHAMQIQFAVQNLANKSPVLVGAGPDGNNVPAYAQTTQTLYDTVGRIFRLSVRMKL